MCHRLHEYKSTAWSVSQFLVYFRCDRSVVPRHVSILQQLFSHIDDSTKSKCLLEECNYSLFLSNLSWIDENPLIIVGAAAISIEYVDPLRGIGGEMVRHKGPQPRGNCAILHLLQIGLNVIRQTCLHDSQARA